MATASGRGRSNPNRQTMRPKLSRELQIRKAVLQGDAEFVKQCQADGGFDVNFRDQNGATYAHHAAFRGEFEV